MKPILIAGGQGVLLRPFTSNQSKPGSGWPKAVNHCVVAHRCPLIGYTCPGSAC
jgi:hypothetical protein